MFSFIVNFVLSLCKKRNFYTVDEEVVQINLVGKTYLIVPGKGWGEGCSMAVRCNTCPLVKINNLDTLCSMLCTNLGNVSIVLYWQALIIDNDKNT